MGALGARSELLSPPESHGLGLALKSDVLWMQMESKAVEEPDGRGLKWARAKASRLRLLVEGSQSFELGSGARLTPSLEMGLRRDGGDAERGNGMEARAGIRYTAPGRTIEASAHSLFGHQRRDYEEWGGRAAPFGWLPGPPVGAFRSPLRRAGARRRAEWTACGRFRIRVA